MSILIEGMDMPKESIGSIRIDPNGLVVQWCGYGNPVVLGHAVQFQKRQVEYKDDGEKK